MTVIIAELSGNHNGDLGKAKELIVAAVRAGCDMVKVQTYQPEDMPDDGGDYEKYGISRDWFPVLYDTAFRYGIPLFSSVFAPWAVDFLEQFYCPIYKIASPESTQLGAAQYLKLAETIAETTAEFWVSSGMRDFADMNDSLEPDLMFFCKSGYPARHLNEEELRFIQKNPCGFSDHTEGYRSTLAAMRAGASHIEKHFKLDDDCVDTLFSLDPDEMRELCSFK